MIFIFLYQILFTLLYPFLAIFLSIKLLIQKDIKKLRQVLFGKITTTPKDIWIHGVSGGEIILVRELLRFAPNNISFHLTTSHVTGYHLLEKEYKNSKNISYSYHPFDVFFIVLPWFHKIKAKKLIVIEHDQWPFILFYLKNKNITRYLINIDFKPRDLKRYKHFSFLLKYLFNFSFFSYQNIEARQKSYAIGLNKIAPYFFDQNLKLLMAIDFMKKKHLAAIPTSRERKWITLGSTHSPEEKLLVDELFSNKKDLANRQLCIIPRHPNRALQLFKIFSDKYRCAYLTNLSFIDPKIDIYIVNSMGLTLGIYKISDLVLIGDSFMPTQGGHNFLEPLYFGTPCVYGQYLRTFSDISPLFEKEKVTCRCDYKEINPLVNRLLKETKEQKKIRREKAFEIINKHLPSQKKISRLFEIML